MAAQVTVGDREITVRRFSGRRFRAMLGVIAEVMRKYPEIARQMAAFDREFSEENRVEIPRAVAEANFDDAKKISDAAWEAAGHTFVRKPSASWEERIMAVFPQVFETAEEQLTIVIGLIAMSNSEVKQARRDDNLAERVREVGDDLMDDGDFDELAALVAAGIEVFAEQYETQRERLGKAAGRVQGLFSTGTPTPETEETTTVESDGSTDPTTSNSPSSTGSPEPTDGEPSRSSTTSSGMTPAASSA